MIVIVGKPHILLTEIVLLENVDGISYISTTPVDGLYLMTIAHLLLLSQPYFELHRLSESLINDFIFLLLLLFFDHLFLIIL